MQGKKMQGYWFASCPKGLEGLLLKELEGFNLSNLRETVAGVEFKGGLESAYRVCLWSRLTNRLLLPICRFPVACADDLYQEVSAINWTEHFSEYESIAVDFVGTGPGVNNTQYGAQRVKDAIVDYFRDNTGTRPDVNLREPDIRINARFAREQVTLSIDFSGESLHKRGYRVSQTTAPLKENLAAALLVRAGWPGEHKALIDPMCGSGTLLIEAAMMAADVAPNLQRERFGFSHWRGHKADMWESIREEARARREQGLSQPLPMIYGYDQDSRAINAAQRNVESAGFGEQIQLSQQAVSQLQCPPDLAPSTGLLIVNPPYGARMGEEEALRGLYAELGDVLKREFAEWSAAVFTGNETLGFALGLRSHKKYKLFNGAIPSQLLLFTLFKEGDEARKKKTEGGDNKPEALSEGAAMLANRLRKNQRKLAPWLKQQGISCYRLYDADLPEYAVAVDCYGDAIHVQEYQAPASIDANMARKRLGEVRKAIFATLKCDQDHFFLKHRQRQSGDSQYQRANVSTEGAGVFEVTEGSARLEVNLQDYLDSGLFLDHRLVRQRVAQLCKGKRLLNLFSYTSTATVQAALGGARSSLSIDMSNTYIDWSKRNFALNNMDGKAHQLLRADCISWLNDEARQAEQGSFDVILLDPPTFSNSAKMEDVLDVQRDHEAMIHHCMGLLAEEGVLVFSNNFRRFKLAPVLEKTYAVENISAASIDRDFARRPRIHQCWLIRKSSGQN